MLKLAEILVWQGLSAKFNFFLLGAQVQKFKSTFLNR